MKEQRPLLGAVELGGTKCVCLIGTGPDDIRAQTSIPTGDSSVATLARIRATLDDFERQHGAARALGIASFGPIDLSRRSAGYGCILSTPKPGWAHTDLLGPLSGGRALQVGFDTDVNGAALAERRWGAGRGLDDLAYITVGTGIGAGLIVGGRTVFGCNHTELGHIRVVRAPGDRWPGVCPFHGDCVEGLASGPAIAARAGMPAANLPADHPAWDLAAHALAQLLHTIVLATAPKRILVGGGVATGHPALLARVRQKLRESLNGYLEIDEVGSGIDQYVIAPGLGALAGPLGALALAADAYTRTAGE
jgi:fructokinase